MEKVTIQKSYSGNSYKVLSAQYRNGKGKEQLIQGGFKTLDAARKFIEETGLDCLN
jgi:hypothetical protein